MKTYLPDSQRGEALTDGSRDGRCFQRAATISRRWHVDLSVDDKAILSRFGLTQQLLGLTRVGNRVEPGSIDPDNLVGTQDFQQGLHLFDRCKVVSDEAGAKDEIGARHTVGKVCGVSQPGEMFWVIDFSW